MQQLTALPGVGEKLAGRIVEYRQKQGAFKNVSDLMNVQGVGEKNLAKIQAFLTSRARRCNNHGCRRPRRIFLSLLPRSSRSSPCEGYRHPFKKRGR